MRQIEDEANVQHDSVTALSHVCTQVSIEDLHWRSRETRSYSLHFFFVNSPWSQLHHSLWLMMSSFLRNHDSREFLAVPPLICQAKCILWLPFIVVYFVICRVSCRCAVRVALNLQHRFSTSCLKSWIKNLLQSCLMQEHLERRQQLPLMQQKGNLVTLESKWNITTRNRNTTKKKLF